MPGIPSARGTTSPEFSTLRAAGNLGKILRSGVTSIACPGGTWFIDVALRDAVEAGLIDGPRINCAGRFIITYGSIIDSEPSWVGTPEHSIGKLCNNVSDMITEVRRQCKHGVNFIKVADSQNGETQTISREELEAVVGEAHRRNAPVAIHSRGAGSTRAAAQAGVDWILHADLAGEADLDAVAEAGSRLVPTATALHRTLELGAESGRSDRELDRIKHHIEAQSYRYTLSVFDSLVAVPPVTHAINSFDTVKLLVEYLEFPPDSFDMRSNRTFINDHLSFLHELLSILHVPNPLGQRVDHPELCQRQLYHHFVPATGEPLHIHMEKTL